MLSSATFHKRVPKGHRKNLEFRRFLISEADRDPSFRQALIEACRQDMLFYINAFVWTFNPKKQGVGKVIPMITWDYQDKAFCSRDPREPGLLWCIENGRDLVMEKSRDMGASWMCLLAFEWMWHFHPDNKFLCISRNADAVDKRGEPKALFWKIDHIHKHLPKWLMPKGYLEDPKHNRVGMMFVNPENGSVLAGEATTERAAIGDRCTAIFVDEFSQIEADSQIRHRTADVSDCRIFNGTHVGRGTEFYKLTIKRNIKRIVMHWTSHPEKSAGAYHYDPIKNEIVPHDPTYDYEKDKYYTSEEVGRLFQMSLKPSGGPFPGVRSPWYDWECLRRDNEREIAMDLDIDPVSSESIFFDALEIANLKTECREPYWEGELLYDCERGLPEELMPKTGGFLKLWLNPKANGQIPPARYVGGADISWGRGATPSCFCIGNADTGEKVGELVTALMKPEDFAPYVVALCRFFKGEDGEPLYLGWEAAGPGMQFGEKVLELGYRKVYYKTDDFDFEKTVSSKPGWYPAPTHKNQLIANYRASLFKRTFYNPSATALDETLLFKYDERGKLVHCEESSEDDPSGANVNHADRVIADALCCKLMGESGPRITLDSQEHEPPVGSYQWRRNWRDADMKRKKAWI